MPDDHDPAPSIGWLRGAITAAIIAVVAIAALVYGTNAELTKVHGKTRSSLVALATITFFVVLLAISWGLRRLQRRNVL